MASIDALENRIGIDFYPQLSDEIENVIEANYELNHWNWTASSLKSSATTAIPAVQCKGNTQKGVRCKN